ncbi:SLC13 family permease [Ostreibacterium oceani]|uniref:SLC13 family permease n=1 Tax=Ostreibacterium oceani TaxID=2654998 RepID=A0A6N7EXJ3_9GAMM|nr:SLC13 family permease [Ostreibacterium oceani]MPV86099.1 SLC13 family permease [Ostreibacterium oceani]
MTTDQALITAILVATLGLFIWNKWRYDIVAMTALVTATLFGLVDQNTMFSGFGHPAVITVAAILIISHALQYSGALEVVANWLKGFGQHTSIQLFLLTGIVAVCSGFMNNVGALALFLPITVALAKRKKAHPGSMLMPISFASLLGGTVTLIGTPPNIIISAYREQQTGTAFSMFDFAPVGMLVALAGVLYLSFIGWRFLPKRDTAASSNDQLAAASEYMTEVRIPANNKYLNRSLYRVLKLCEGEAIQILSIVRGEQRMLAPTQYEILRENDILVVEGQPDAIQQFLDDADFEMVDAKVDTQTLQSDTVSIVEVVIGPDSRMIGRSASGMHLSANHGINLMAISRRGQSIKQRLHRTTLRAGDVLLLQSDQDSLAAKLEYLGCFPLAERNITLGKHRKMWTTIAIFAVAILVTSLTNLSSSLTFTAAVGALVVTKIVNLRNLYNSVEWPVIVLLAALIPVGQALETTGTTGLIANGIVHASQGASVYILLGVVIIISMLLSDVINNAATAVIMAPIGASIATSLGYPVEAFLMAVCIGASCTFLSPIGHQSNLLVMSPGGYRFGDYARMGWLLDIIVVLVAVPAIAFFWL